MIGGVTQWTNLVHSFRMELQEWREAQGLTVEQLASMLGLHPKTLRRYETGVRMVPADVMVDLFLLSEGRLRPDHLAVPKIRRLYVAEDL